MEITKQPVAKAQLLIRKPVAEVFEAFVNPDTITKFWFSRSSAPLESGKTVRWYWDMYDFSVEVRVKAIEEDKRILIEWESQPDNATTVEWTFETRSDDTTYVSIVNEGFAGDGDTIVATALDSAGGFAYVLAAAKAYLEHGIELNIVADRF